MGNGKFTEGKFKKFCTVNNIYCNRLNDNIGNNQPADYLIIFKEKYGWVEVKEVEYESTYDFKRTTQESALLLLTKINIHTESYILIYFKAHKQIVYLPINKYIELKNKSTTKSYLKLSDVPFEFIFSWSNIITQFT